jgi:hypothetical protein
MTQEAAGTQIEEFIAAERRELASLLAALPDADWDTPSLCAGWRVREVVAHMTMPFRYSTLRFATALARARLDFAKMADRCARRDAAAPPAELVAALRDNERYPWQPPGGGFEGGLEPFSWWYIPESGICHQPKVTRRRSPRPAIRDAI